MYFFLNRICNASERINMKMHHDMTQVTSQHVVFTTMRPENNDCVLYSLSRRSIISISRAMNKPRQGGKTKHN